MVDEGEYGREQDDELEVDDDEDGAAPAKLPWLIRANGDHEFPKPQNGRTWTLKELKSIVRGSVDMLPVPSASGLEKCLMVVNDNGQLKGLPPNSTASLLMRMNLVGDVLVCPDEMIP